MKNLKKKHEKKLHVDDKSFGSHQFCMMLPGYAPFLNVFEGLGHRNVLCGAGSEWVASW